jgi:hypothetical protein
MAGETVNTLKAEAEKSLGNFITVLLEIVLPIVLFFIGLGIIGPAIGLSGFYAGFLSHVPSVPQTASRAIASGSAILTYLALGGGLVAVERIYDGWMGDIVGAFGWMLMGAGLREVIAFLTNTPMGQNAWLAQISNSLTTGLTQAVQGQ